jgi:Co/Zn/Cd efflux system component
MRRTEFRIPKMDCSAEEQLIRLKLEPLPGILDLRFDLQARRLEVFHTGEARELRDQLEPLNLGAEQVAHEEGLAEILPVAPAKEKGPLLAALSINASLFVAEFTAGILAYSMGLIGDSLDMLADAIVYAMALAAVGGSAARKISIARLTGYFQGFLAFSGLAEVIRRALVGEGTPDFKVMILLSCIALAGNTATLLILNRNRNAGVHMKAAWICTSVDIQVNALVIASAGVVYFTGSRYPDLAVGAVLFLLVANGARRILSLAPASGNPA